MYPWNEPDSGVNHEQDQTPAPADFTKAIQFALDRRDNGGDAVPARQPAAPPAASLTRQ
jgi:hypothetical protein